jgi:hypothetical protein
LFTRAPARFFWDKPAGPAPASLLQDKHPQDRFGAGSCRTAYAFDSAIADIGADWVLRHGYGGLLTVAAPTSRTTASSISELTLPSQNRRSLDQGFGVG